ncbi:MAG: hypothetical protein IVW56_09620 [Candidatus Binataceae bacterium]|nr:hypothetical protein [Candidatus Binataceae bacterium]
MSVELSFGVGALWGERTDVTGTGIGPRQFGRLQDISVTFDFTDKPLYGQSQFPVAIARGQGKITFNAKFAQILGNLYSDLFFGSSPAAGQFGVTQLEAAAVPATTPYTVTVANAATFNDDLGVVYAATGLAFQRVTTPTTAGQYSVNAATGVYTFSAADESAAVLISYTYNVSATGFKTTISNQLQGTTPTFKLTLFETYQGLGQALRLNACIASKLMLPNKIDEWAISELDGSAFADASGTIGYLSTVQ